MALVLAAAAAAAPAGELERALMPGPVARAHQDVEGDCARCHVRFDRTAQRGLCLGCHEDVGKDRKARLGFHGRSATGDCRECHREHEGREADIVGLDPAQFRHDLTDFALTGAHVGVECRGCHSDGARHREASSDCVSCHRDDDRHAGRLGARCGDCHAAASWTDVRFDHAVTGFKLNGVHATARCESCHREKPTQRRLEHGCVACHRDDDHHRGALGSDCASCHGESDWTAVRFDHSRTGFALAGQHREAGCVACHREPGTYRGAPGTCVGCHRDDDRHRGNLGSECGSCHDPRAWKPASGFDHGRTAFALDGVHATTACSGCHAGADAYRGTTQACVACHRDDDAHHGRNGDNCADCHASSDWKRSRFDHDRATHFPLREAHRRVACAACHVQPVTVAKPGTTCGACHRDDDPHRGRLGSECTQCHTEADWKRTHFDHDRSSFPLIGAHRTAPCAGCHRSSLYADTDSGCMACHCDDDRHDGRYGSDCARCHNARDWRLWDFDHATTRFALGGAHASARCDACHGASGATSRPSMECGNCHQRDDAHEGGFGPQCERCHTTTSFREVRSGFDRRLP